MSRTRARDNIRLASGETLTLGEAIDRKLVVLKTIDNYPHKYPRYIAREVNADFFWDIGAKLYETRTKGATS
jgi:hypothetical protein